MFTSAYKNVFVMLLIASSLFACRPMKALHMNTPDESAGQANTARSHHLTLITEPANALVEILNLETPYQPSIPVKPGIYHMVVSAPGHETVKGYITITDRDWVGRVTLKPLAEQTQKAEKAEKATKEETSTAQLDEMRRALQQEQNKLEEARLLLAQEQEKTELAKQKLAMEKEALALAKQEWDTQRLANAPSTENKIVEKPSPWGAQPQISVTDQPAQPGTGLIPDFPMRPDALIAQPPLDEAAKSPTDETTIEDIIAADESSPEQHPSAAKTAVSDQPTTLFAEAMAYLQQAPAQQGDLAASKEALRKLQQAQKQDPNNKKIKEALQMYNKRYVIRVASYKQQKGGNTLLTRLSSLRIPSFQQTATVQGSSVQQIYIGPFPTRTEANKQLSRLPANIKKSDAILRIYNK